MATETIYEVAAELRCKPRKIADTARAHNIGINLKGRAGWRFDEADKVALKKALAPTPPPNTPRRRRRRPS